MSRGRPPVYDNLKQTSIMVEQRALQLAKDIGLDIGQVCRDAINQAIGDDRKIEQATERKEAEAKFEGMPKDEVKNMIETLRRHPDSLPKVIDWANRTYDKKITKEDLEKLIIKY